MSEKNKSKVVYGRLALKEIFNQLKNREEYTLIHFYGQRYDAREEQNQ